MPRSIRFLFRDRWTSGIVSSSGSLEDYDSSNTQRAELASTWRSGGLSSVFISCDLGTTYRVGAVCLVKTNLTSAATFRVRVGNTSDFSTNLYDSGYVARNRYFSDSEVTTAKTSEFFLNGLPTITTQSQIQRQVIAVILPTEVTAQFVRIDFLDATNPNGYIEVGFIYAGIVYEPSRDLLFGWKIQRDNIIRGGQAASGQYWSASVYRKTLVQFSLAPQAESEVTGVWMLFEHLVSIHKSMVIQLVDFTDSLRFTTTIYGKLTESVVNRKSAYNSYLLSYSIEEIVD